MFLHGATCITHKITPLPIVLVGRSFWLSAFDFDFLLDMIAEEDLCLFGYSETAKEIHHHIAAWYNAAVRLSNPAAKQDTVDLPNGEAVRLT